MDCALPGEFFSLSMSEAEKNDENVMSVTANEIKQKKEFPIESTYSERIHARATIL